IGDMSEGLNECILYEVGIGKVGVGVVGGIGLRIGGELFERLVKNGLGDSLSLGVGSGGRFGCGVGRVLGLRFVLIRLRCMGFSLMRVGVVLMVRRMMWRGYGRKRLMVGGIMIGGVLKGFLYVLMVFNERGMKRMVK
ncbi:iron chelate uptake ABC transporter family permease subunit, partial [Staphylococcus auricularis]|uniref:iron chelate uptake ABC transporter family permease subunit n=1 Tax=Staphylococcus auricularis TaxID=29379 RepID=UPI001248BCD7